MIMLPILYLFFLICLFIVCICNRRQQQTFSNAYHSSVACGRSTGDSAIGHGFGAAALRSNASHICLLVYLCIIFWISHLFLNKKVTRKRGIKFKNGTRFLMNVSPFFSLYFPPPPYSYENFDSGHSDNNEQPGPARVTLAWKRKRKRNQRGRRQSALFHVGDRLLATWIDFTHTRSVVFIYFFSLTGR
jgi:hypothetical protein